MTPGQITLHDKTFEINIPEREIRQVNETLGARISADYQDKKPIFLAVLNGAFMFAADLMKEINIPCEIAFLRVSSYQDMHSNGQVSEIMGLKEDIRNRHIIILEDIVDTGHTVKALLENLSASEPASVQIASLLVKPESMQHQLEIKYTGLTIPNDFVVGYGLDYNGLGRNLRDIYKVVQA